MFIRDGIKKVKYGLMLLVAISSVEVHSFSYTDYLNNTLPYAAVLAFIATNYYRRSLASSHNTYDAFSYAAPVVAAGAGSLLAQPDNWHGAFARSLPAMIFALGALGLERINAPKPVSNSPEPVSFSPLQDQKTGHVAMSDNEPISVASYSPSNNPVSENSGQGELQAGQDLVGVGQETESKPKVETHEDLVRRFFEQKTEFEKLWTRYNKQINQIDDIIDSLFITENVVQTESDLVSVYAQAAQSYKELQGIYTKLQALDAKIKESAIDQAKIKLVDTIFNPLTKSMSKIVDPVQVVAAAAYANALINLYIKVGQNEEIYKRPIIELMPEVLNIKDFFDKYSLIFSDDVNVTDLIRTVNSLVIKRLDFFKNADQITSKLLNDFSALNTKLNGYLKDNKKKEFRDNFQEIKNYYNKMKTWHQNYKQEIELMNSRVAHIFETNSLLDRVNIYKNIGDMSELPWQGYAIALLQRHYITRKRKKINDQSLLRQARKDNYINQNQYDQLDTFIRQVDNEVLQKMINLLGEYINFG